MQGLCSISAHFWAPQKAGMRQPILILCPLLGTPENAGVMRHFHPLSGAQEGRGEAANSDFVTFVGDPRESRGYVAFRPTFGRPRRQG